MPTAIETTVYKFSELSDTAKRKAIDNNRDWNVYDEWSDCVKDDFEAIGGILGIEFGDWSAIGSRSQIWFSGFSSQGDGACFEGIWRYSKGMAKKIRQHAPNDTELNRIAGNLSDIQKRWFYGIRTVVTHYGRYYHEHTMRFEHSCNTDCALPESVTDEIEELLRDLARWYYSRLGAAYDYLTSDEAVAESLECNEVQFHESGSTY